MIENDLAGAGVESNMMKFAVEQPYINMRFKGVPPDRRYGKPSMYHIILCIKCTLHIKKIFARMRVEPKLGVTYDTLYKMYIVLLW